MDQLQVVAEPTRRRILALVWDEEMTAGDVAAQFEVTFGAVSQHLGVLRRAGLVSVRQAGIHRYYSARRESLGPLRPLLEALWIGKLDQLAAAVEDDRDD